MSDPLLRRLSTDLDDAFPDLLDGHGAMVATLAAALTDPSTGEDITQDVFLRAYRALAGYPEPRILELQLRPWLATITRNLVRNEYRRRRRRPTVGTELADDDTTGGDVIEEAERVVERLDRGAAVSLALDTLNDRQREVVLLRYAAELSVDEVAAITGHPTGTVKSHAARGLRLLRQELTRTEVA